MIDFLLPFLVLPLVICNPLQLNLLSTPNVSSIASGRSSSLNATRLTTHNECFDGSYGHKFPATKSDCERALDTLVKGKSLLELRRFGYTQVSRLTDRLPVAIEYGSCAITLMMFEYDMHVAMTYAEIYAELLGPDGMLKECLGPNVPAAHALGGQTAIGPRNMLVVDVSGQSPQAAEQKSR